MEESIGENVGEYLTKLLSRLIRIPLSVMRNIKFAYRSGGKEETRGEKEIKFGKYRSVEIATRNFVQVSSEWFLPGELIAANKYKSFNFRIEIVENFNSGHKLAIVNDRA